MLRVRYVCDEVCYQYCMKTVAVVTKRSEWMDNGFWIMSLSSQGGSTLGRGARFAMPDTTCLVSLLRRCNAVQRKLLEQSVRRSYKLYDGR